MGDIGKKVVSSIKIWTDDENSNPGSELPPRTRRKSSNETRISASTFQSETASLLEQQASPQAGSRLEQKVTVEIGVQVNSEDLVFAMRRFRVLNIGRKKHNQR